MKKILLLTVAVILLCVVSCGFAEERIYASPYGRSIPILDLETGITTNQSFIVLKPYVSCTPSYQTMYIDGSYYSVCTSATYGTNDCVFGPIGLFSTVDLNGITTEYNPAAYWLKVQAVPYYVTFRYYARGSKDASGNYTFGGSNEGSGTSYGTKYYYKHLIQ